MNVTLVLYIKMLLVCVFLEGDMLAKEAKSNGVAVQTAENAAESEEVGQTVESVEASPEELPEDKLPFPRATVVNQMRKYLDSGKQIKGQVKDEMNIWLGKII